MIGINNDKRPPFVQFEWRAVHDREATEREGRAMFKDVAFALITPAGSKDVVEKVWSEWIADKKRQAMSGMIPAEWIAHFELSHKAWLEQNEPPEFGTSVKMWPALTPSQVQRCVTVGLRTIEDMAEASEEAIQRYGMGGRDLKEKARAYLQSAVDHGKVAERVASLTVENEALRERLDMLQAQLDALGEKRGPGRPRKVEAEAA